MNFVLSLRISAARIGITGPDFAVHGDHLQVNSLALLRQVMQSSHSASEIQFQGSSDGVNWTVLYSTTTIGSVAEILTGISSNLIPGNFQQHRFAIQSQGAPIARARRRNSQRGDHRHQRGMKSRRFPTASQPTIVGSGILASYCHCRVN
jgi:hypothetical protein